MAGAFSAVFTTPILAPGERIKCLLQVSLENLDASEFFGVFFWDKGYLDCYVLWDFDRST